MANPTVVLVHGAFADASGWSAVIRELEAAGFTAIAPPNPLRGLRSDADAVAAFVGAIEGPVLLVGHSYGGAVISRAASDLPNVSGLVYQPLRLKHHTDSAAPGIPSYAGASPSPGIGPRDPARRWPRRRKPGGERAPTFGARSGSEGPGSVTARTGSVRG